ncbi:carboxymuconolactone decarboxylase family protein [Nocardioides sp. B-3]|uniref:carboxymuconolactone decarboxylase family protein n=1 Tax=Nocardioides sp. B-3 TaxID=2895565 RepID=UPI0021538EEA|nr:carboxymuconolactone decarboxylase family protein [Nocardioides sp. B-3]UUZ60325.1 carboxymuconolactone decarboxylase family protein [Nocardioides sp. B-3]
MSLLSTAAAFGVARLVFQEGWGAGFFGFESRGFLDAWAPVFFFAMIFAIAMDYTVFLLASAKEHYEHSRDPHEAMVGAVAHSGRVIFAAGAVMVAVFFTFAPAGPLPPKEMGIILGIAVLLDAFPGPPHPAARPAPPDRTRRLVGPELADPDPAEDPLRPRVSPTLPRSQVPREEHAMTTTTHTEHGSDVLTGLAPLHRELRRAIPDVYKGFGELHKAAFTPGELDVKTKELIALAIGVVEGCDGCIASHARAAARAGASRRKPPKPSASPS